MVDHVGAQAVLKDKRGSGPKQGQASGGAGKGAGPALPEIGFPERSHPSYSGRLTRSAAVCTFVHVRLQDAEGIPSVLESFMRVNAFTSLLFASFSLDFLRKILQT